MGELGAGTLLARTRGAETDLEERLELKPLALALESRGFSLSESSLSLLHDLGHNLPWPWSTKLRNHVSFRRASREPQGLWVSHTAQRTERVRSTPFTPLFFSSPLEPNSAPLEASIHSFAHRMFPNRRSTVADERRRSLQEEL